MAYTPTVWKNGEFPPIDAEHLNKIEQGIADAVSVTPQSLSDAQKTQARTNINAAPGGFGLGENIEVPYNVDANECLNNGWYAPGKNVPVDGIWIVRVDAGGGYVRQTAYAIKNSNAVPDYVVCRRSFSQNKWSPWDWVNPPMEMGVEYRTTELYLGKPVYFKVVDCGTCPANGYKDVVYGTTGIVLPIRCEGTWSYANRSTIPFESSNEDQLHIGALGGAIRIKTGGKDFSGFTCTATVWYTKTTD